MKRLSLEFYIVVGILLILGGLWFWERSQFQTELRALHRIETELEKQPPASLPVELQAQVSPSKHASAVEATEAVAGVPLSRIAKLIIQDEGKRSRPYLDPEGNPTIGVGRNLRGNGISISELQGIVNEIDYDAVLRQTKVENGRVHIASLKLANQIFVKPLTEDDIQLLLVSDLAEVVKVAASIFPKVWQDIDSVRQEVILDTLFNLGENRFKEFVKFIAAVKVKDWKTAANELLLSEAAHENPERYFRNSRVIRTGNPRYLER